MALLDMLTSQLGGTTNDKLAGMLGTDSAQTQSAIEAAIPALLGAVTRNASQPEGAQALASALDRHDGSILDGLDDQLDGVDTDDGDKIVNHMLGDQRGQVEAAVASHSGLDMGSIAKLLPMLAPIVMGMLGRKKRADGLDAGGLGSMLGGEGGGLASVLGNLGGLGKVIDLNSVGDMLGGAMGGASTGGDGISVSSGGGSAGGAGGLLGKLLGMFKRR